MPDPERIDQIPVELTAEPGLNDWIEILTAAGVSNKMKALWLPGRSDNSLPIARLNAAANVKSMLAAADYAAVRTLLSLVPGTNVQAFHANLAAWAGLVGAADKLGYFTGAGALALTDFTTVGRALAGSANVAAAQAGLSLVPGTHVQVHSGALTTWAALLLDLPAARQALGLEIGVNVAAYDALLAGLSSNIRTMLGAADYAAVRTALSLVVGTNVQAYHAMLASLAGLGGAADKGLHLTAANTLALHDLTAAGRAMNAAADAAAQRALLSLTRVRQVQLAFLGGSNPLAVGNTCFSLCSYAGTLKKAYLTSLDEAGAALAGSIVIDVWKASGIPTVANTITAAAKPTLSSASTSLDSTLTGWTTGITAGDRFIGKIDSVSGGLKNVILTLELET